MPWSNLWYFLFFLCMVFLGIDTQFACLEVFVSCLADLKLHVGTLWDKNFKPDHRQNVQLACMIGLICGLILTTHGGRSWFQMMDAYGFIIPCAITNFLDVIIWIYLTNFESLTTQLGDICNEKIPSCWWVSWKFVNIGFYLFLMILGVYYTETVLNYKFTWPMVIVGHSIVICTCLPAVWFWWKLRKVKNNRDPFNLFYQGTDGKYHQKNLNGQCDSMISRKSIEMVCDEDIGQGDKDGSSDKAN
jgi:hypothetical protein